MKKKMVITKRSERLKTLSHQKVKKEVEDVNEKGPAQTQTEAKAANHLVPVTTH